MCVCVCVCVTDPLIQGERETEREGVCVCVCVCARAQNRVVRLEAQDLCKQASARLNHRCPSLYVCLISLPYVCVCVPVSRRLEYRPVPEEPLPGFLGICYGPAGSQVCYLSVALLRLSAL